jgi:thioredoxin 1
MKQILYFSAEWCSPCRMLGPTMQSIAGQINYQKVDVDKDRELPIKYGVRNIPTLVLLENGKEKNRLVGAHPKEKILEFYNG